MYVLRVIIGVLPTVFTYNTEYEQSLILSNVYTYIYILLPLIFSNEEQHATI